MSGLAERPALSAQQFCQAQERLGMSNLELARALEIKGKGGAQLIALYRQGKRPVPARASQLLRIWLQMQRLVPILMETAGLSRETRTEIANLAAMMPPPKTEKA